MSFPAILIDGLWHSTNYEGYEGIVRSGAILSEPDIPDCDRWCVSQGAEHYPYVRSLGGVSLFDFRNFEPLKYSKKYPVSSWQTFVPLDSTGGLDFWLEVDRSAVTRSLISGKALVDQWKQDCAFGNNLMPIIEVAHIGPVPLRNVVRVLRHVDGKWEKIG